MVLEGKRILRASDGERGIVLVLFVITLMAALLSTGLVVDLGMAYIARSRMATAIDAGALAASRHTGKGVATMQQMAEQVARANYSAGGAVHYDIAIDYPSTDAIRVSVDGEHDTPGVFARLIGQDVINVRARGEATRFPLDLALSLDVSLSLERNGAFDDLQDAAEAFVEYFDDNIDQFALVSYSTVGATNMTIRKNFKALAQDEIRDLEPITDTNIDEGLRLAKVELDNAPVRENAVKIVVLFTDGRPTAFRDIFPMNTPHAPDPYDAVVTSYISGSWYRGLFDPINGLKVVGFNGDGSPILYPNASYASSPRPRWLPGGLAVNGYNIRALGIEQAEEQAESIRQAGYVIYVVALGNPNAVYEGDQPDLDFLRRLANENGVVSANEPKGQMVFSPSAAELNSVFSLIADRILRRITG